MEFDSRSPSYARQDGHVEQYSFRRAVAFFKNFGSNNASAHSPGLSRVTTPILCPSLAALNELSLIERHPLVGRAQDIGYDASETPHHEESPTSHAYITDLCNVLRTFGEEWIRRLASCTNVPQVLPEQYFCSLLKLGIRSLRNHFRGASPRSFQDIFALIHVAMASSYIVCEDDHDYPGNAFLEEAYQWQNLLSDEIEKGAFSKVMSQLCHSQELAASSSFKEVTVDNSFLPAEQAMLVRLIDHLSSNRVDMGIKENSDVDRENSAVENEQSRSPRLLQSNAIIKGCMGFLDDFGHAVIVEDLGRRQNYSSWYVIKHLRGIETLDRNVVGRLHEWKGLEAFHGGITETQRMLRGGLLNSARDVEIMLVWFGKSFSTSPRLLRRYLDVVKALCDAVMKDLGPRWRDPFYEVILGTVLATAAESSRYQGHAIQIPPSASSDKFILSSNAELSTPPANAAMPPVKLHSSTASSSDSAPTSSAPSDDILHCPDPSCKVSFTGSSRRTNLTRHLNTALHHRQDVELKCRVCRVTFSRMDNLQQHVRNIHGLDSALRSQKT